MDTNTLQILVTLLAQQRVEPSGGASAIITFGLLVPSIIAVLASVAIWIKADAAEKHAKAAVEKTEIGNKDIAATKLEVAEVKKGVNGAMEKLMAAEHERGMANGKTEERAAESQRQATVTAVKVAIASEVKGKK